MKKEMKPLVLQQEFFELFVSSYHIMRSFIFAENPE